MPRLTERDLQLIHKHFDNTAEIRLTDGKKLFEYIEQQDDIIKGLQQVIDLALWEIDKYTAMLRRLEYIDPTQQYPFCPCCYGEEHTPDCELAALLSGIPKERGDEQ